VITVAHRLSTVRTFDRIVVMQSGRIVQDGPPEDLMQREGVYRELMRGEIARLVTSSAAA
jgi:ATP-binding cassette, subfamily B, bacterial